MFGTVIFSLIALAITSGLLVWFFLMKYSNSTKSQRRKYWELSPHIVRKLRFFKRKYSKRLTWGLHYHVTKEFFVMNNIKDNKFEIAKWQIGWEGPGEYEGFYASLTVELLGDFLGEPKYLTLNGFDYLNEREVYFKTEDISRESFDNLLDKYSQVIEAHEVSQDIALTRS